MQNVQIHYDRNMAEALYCPGHPATVEIRFPERRRGIIMN